MDIEGGLSNGQALISSSNTGLDLVIVPRTNEAQAHLRTVTSDFLACGIAALQMNARRTRAYAVKGNSTNTAGRPAESTTGGRSEFRRQRGTIEVAAEGLQLVAFELVWTQPVMLGHEDAMQCEVVLFAGQVEQQEIVALGRVVVDELGES